MKIATLTVTRGREELLALCIEMIEAQTRRPDFVKIVKHDRDAHPWKELAVALRQMPANHYVAIIEDDDWYSPAHLATLAYTIKGAKIAGSPCVRQFNVPGRLWQCSIATFTPPCGVMLAPGYVKEYADLIEKGGKADREAWLGHLPTCPPTMVGIKGVGFGLPGLKGCTRDHDPKNPRLKTWNHDPRGEWLADRIGVEWRDRYFQLCMDKSASS